MLMHMVLLLLLPFRAGGTALQELTEQQQATLLQSHFLFSLVWSLGANTDRDGRAVFDGLLRKLISRNTPPELSAHVHAPEVGTSIGGPSTLADCGAVCPAEAA